MSDADVRATERTEVRAGEAAVLVIDVQAGLFDGLVDSVPPPHEGLAVIERINALTGRARAASVPVVLIQHERAEGFLAHGSASWQLQPRLVAADNDLRLRKATPDSFLRTDLAERLAAWGTRTLVVCGYATEFCIDTTVRRAAALGFDIVLASDAHTTSDKPHANGAQIRAHHNATLPWLTSFGRRIVAVPSDSLVFASATAEVRPQ